MDCPEVTRRLWEYLDDELVAKEAQAVDRHLAGCRVCSARYGCARAFLDCLVRSLSQGCRAPERLRTGLLERLGGHDRPR